MPTPTRPPQPSRLGLQDLRRVHDAQQRAAREQAEREAAERARQVAAERERHWFRHAVGPVEPLRTGDPVRPERSRPAPIARQRALDEAQALRETWSDGFDAETLIDSDDSLAWRRSGIGIDVIHKLRRGIWAVQAQCDLHGLRRDEAREQLATFLRDALRQGLRCVRVIHGKGNGSPGRSPVLKGKVRHWLVQKNEVLAFAQARATQGGQGALMVLLQPSGGVVREVALAAESGSPGNPAARAAAQHDQAPALLRIQSAVPKKA